MFFVNAWFLFFESISVFQCRRSLGIGQKYFIFFKWLFSCMYNRKKIAEKNEATFWRKKSRRVCVQEKTCEPSLTDVKLL
jgi:hypothetical protein